MIEKPCTKIQYKVKNAKSYGAGDSESMAHFKLAFDSPEVTVYEEYLIFDFVAMVSAIGGTLGLCTGFSFSGVTETILTLSGKVGEHITNVWLNKKEGI